MFKQAFQLWVILCIGFLLAGCATTDTNPDAVYYLVRHAEKTTEKPDPALTDQGKVRAEALAVRLNDLALSEIYSSDYKRTRDTAKPVMKDQDIGMKFYDPKDLPGFATLLKSRTGHILVVGHSNTTPDLSGFLGGETGEPIVEASEYDRLYVLERRGDIITTDIQRFGN